jgi:hypothetical protein
MFTRSKKEQLKDQIDKLDTTEHRQIYNIIKNHSPQVTKVQNGILVSTDTLNDECLTEVDRYVSFCLDQRKRMDEDLKTRKTYERMLNA